MSLFKLILEQIEPKINEIIKRLEDALDIRLVEIEFPEMEYMGRGSYAEVYSIEVYYKAIRFEDVPNSHQDSFIKEKLINHNLSNVVQIYLHKTIDDYQITIMEELELLDEDFDSVIMFINYSFPDGLYNFFRMVDPTDKEEIIEVLECTEEQAEEIMEYSDQLDQIARGIRQLNNNGILHNDIKSNNIMQDGKGTIKIIDMF